MKFKKLTKEFVKLLDKKDRGKELDPDKVEMILSALKEKKVRYEKKLQSDLGEKERHIAEVKLKVVELQIQKLDGQEG